MPPQMNRQITQKGHASGRFVTTVLFVAAVIVAGLLLKHQAVYDWLRLRNYSAPPDIVQIAAQDTLTNQAKHILYVNHPVIESKAAFAQSCPNGDKETAVLGCYIPPQRGIYVLGVTDPRLAGIEQVTTAHEMLHAAYDRLSSGEKEQVNAWLMDYYNNGLHDETIRKQLDSYKKTEPNDLVNEMHSIFGTEIGGLPTNLETYYARYFTDRSKVTTYYNTYEVEFTSRQLQIAQDDARLKSLRSQIDALQTSLKAAQADLNRRQNQLNQQQSSGNISGYNANVPGYNAAVNAYNAQVSRLKSLIREYNQLVAARNGIVLEEQQLAQDISSQVSPIGKQ